MTSTSQDEGSLAKGKASIANVVTPYSRDLTVGIVGGLHARPSTLLVKLAKCMVDEDRGENVVFQTGNGTANPQSILSLMVLALGNGSKVTVTFNALSAERANAFLNPAEQILTQPYPERIIHQADAARILMLDPQIAELLRREVRKIDNA